MSQKARNLEILGAAGVVVPRGFTLSADHYQRALSLAADEISAALPDAEKVAAVFAAMELPAETATYIDANVAALHDVKRFAVRSSGAIAAGSSQAILEDGPNVSLAGQFESFLNVPADFVSHAVRRCWASLFNPRSIVSFGNHPDYVRSSAMTVVIQEMIPAKASAVMMTADPMGDGRTGAVEFTWGPCGAIVGGFTSPDEAIFDRATGRLISIRLGRKERRLRYGDYGCSEDNETKVDTSVEDQCLMSIESATLMRLITLGDQIERLFGRPQDIEAVVTNDNNIVVTQARPVTMLPGDCVPFNASTAA